MPTFTEFIDTTLTEIDYQDSRTETLLRQITLGALRRMGQHRTQFMDNTFSFTTEAGRSVYPEIEILPPDSDEFADWDEPPTEDVAVLRTSGWQQDVQRIYCLSTSYNDEHILIPPGSITEVRRRSSSPTSLSGGAVWPEVYAWHARQIFFPIPLDAPLTITIDYRRDARRDSTTGDLLTVNSSTESNPWLEEGEDVLRLKVLQDYAFRVSKDFELGNFLKGQLGDALVELDEGWADHKQTAVQGMSYF